MKFILLFAGFFTSLLMHAQCTLQLSGHILDAETREHLSDAVIEIQELGLSTKANKEGVYTFKNLCPGFFTLRVTHVSCSATEYHLHLTQNLEKDFEMNHAALNLSEVVVQDPTTGANIVSTSTIKGKVLESSRGLSLAQTLQKISGVSVLQTGSNIDKPVIHGLHSNRILIITNGVRLESQQWGSEHAPEIDPFNANRITIIKGASAIRYGGDAIAGVVLTEPKLLRKDPGINSEINSVYFSNNRMGVFSGMIEGNSIRLPAFSWRVQGTYKRGGNSKTPAYWLANSGVEERCFSVTTAFKNELKGLELFISHFDTRLGIFSGSHIGNVTDLWSAIQMQQPPDYIRNADFTYSIGRPFQKVSHQMAKAKLWTATGTKGRITATLSGQQNNRSEYDQKRFAGSSNLPQLDLSIQTAIGEFIWEHFQTGAFKGSVGTSLMYQYNRYERRFFIPNFESINAGFFMIEKWTGNKLGLEAGVRFDHKSIYNVFKNGSDAFLPQRVFNNFSGNIGCNYFVLPGLQFIMNVASAWRAPQLNELYASGLHHGAARIEKGDSSLKAEQSNTFSSTIEYSHSKWNLEVSVYQKHIRNFIFLEPTFPPELTIRGAFPSFRYTQANVRMHGLDLTADCQIDAHWKGSVKATILRAWNQAASDWLIQMPSDRFESQVQYRFGNAKRINDSYICFNTAYTLRQIRFPKQGNIEVPGTTQKQSDYLNPPPAFFLLGVELGTHIKVGHDNWSLILEATNLTNRRYRNYMNAFRYFSDEIGRNIAFRLKIPFEIKHKHKP